MKKINKESLQKFEEKIKQYEYYQFQGVSRFLTRKKEVNLEIAFFNNEGYRELQYFEFTIKFFDNKFRPKYFPEYEIYHTYKSPVAFISMSDETHSLQEDVIKDDDDVFKMINMGELDWKIEFDLPNSFGLSEELRNAKKYEAELKQEAADIIQEKHGDCGYKLAVEMSKLNIPDQLGLEALGSIHRASQLLGIIDDVFDNEKMKEVYYEKMTDEDVAEAVYNLIRNINKRVGDNNLDDYDYSLFFRRGIFETNIGISITNIHTGEEL